MEDTGRSIKYEVSNSVLFSKIMTTLTTPGNNELEKKKLGNKDQERSNLLN
jgi:hypothetical protein